MCSEIVKNRPKSAKCAISMVLLCVACRINEVLVLVFKSRHILLFLLKVFSPKFQNLQSKVCKVCKKLKVSSEEGGIRPKR